MFDKPELDGVFSVSHNGDHHDVEHTLVQVATGDGENVDIGMLLGLGAHANTGEHTRREIETSGEVVPRRARLRTCFKDIVVLVTGFAGKTGEEGAALEGQKCDFGALIARLGPVSKTTNTIDIEELLTATRLEVDLPHARLRLELEVSQVGHNDSIREMRIIVGAQD